VLHLPSRNVSETAASNLERFAETAFARRLREDRQHWDVVEWSWTSEPPVRVQLRSTGGDVVEFVMDETGSWWVHPDANAPRQPVGG
jgi:hypothetical protein